MSDIDKLREALTLLYEPNPDYLGRNTTPVRWPLDFIAQAARDYLALLESDAIVIKRDAEGNWPDEWVDRLAKATHNAIQEGSLHSEPWEGVYSMQKDTDRHYARLTLDALADSSKAPE